MLEALAQAQAPLIVLVVPGKPEGKGRPKFNGKTGRAYTPRKTELAEGEIRRVWELGRKPRLPDDAAVRLVVLLRVERPMDHFKKDGSLSAEGLRHPIPRNRKPDLDNAVKLVMDALNTRAYRDDVQVAEVSAKRRWGAVAETVIWLESLSVDELAESSDLAA